MTDISNEARGVSTDTNTNDEAANITIKGVWMVRLTIALLILDATLSVIFLSPIEPFIHHHEGESDHYTFGGSLKDLLWLSAARIAVTLIAFLVSFLRGQVRPETPFELYHPNGTKKTKDELEEEALEQSFGTWLRRYIHRAASPCEFLALLSTLLCVAKCLVRLNIEIGVNRDAEPLHPIFWCAILVSSLCSVTEMSLCDMVCVRLGEWGHLDRQKYDNGNAANGPSLLRQISSHLSLPLLANDALLEESSGETNDEEQHSQNGPPVVDDENAPGVSDIGGDTDYKASWSDLIKLCAPDTFLILVAFVFLLLAAAAQIYIPRFTGAILDALEEAYSKKQIDSTDDDLPIQDIPGFMSNVRKLIIVSLLGGIFSGVRGSIFTVVGGRVNVRLRLRLMDALLCMEQGFFDVTKTGDITSRLSSDTTLVGDQVTLNVNVFLRSLVQVIGVLIFMFMVSWQLSILAFISVPVITVLSKWYGQFIRSLTKLMQSKLAEGNSISEAAISSMPTVRAFDAAPTEYKEFQGSMDKYLALTYKSAIAYSGYATVATSLPQLVTALVVFYGGLMVRNGDISSGELVSFLLYLQSLSDAFSSIGYIFSSLTQAVGAADKVFELMNRKPKLREPSTGPRVTTSRIEKYRTSGLQPDTCRGEIILKNVEMYYPARPQKRVLNGMSLAVPPGKIVALVGQSGGGKSSVISLVQHMYEESSGTIKLDGIKVHELSPQWLSHHVSIVQQEPTLFGRSIRRNIIYGLEGTDKEPSQEEIERVARLANCDDFIRKMPMQYETEVGERGVTLSGGQKQRLAIARALVRKPKILLLDEATSALDAESEHMVQEAIDHMIETARSKDGSGMSVMIVAHRLSTIRNADIIFVIQDGQVIEQGNHSELIEKENGAYSSLIRRQMDVHKKLESGKTETK
ncbi:efflux ABC transporter permease/ATP-binding protein [Nitzschia inconspicua]|uniref:Efflux ABC transporter permease/ATP-binding protein n=1 Tax=Nitzschia inconspicua TaxID=303405 RepID=A0A9K3KMM2_9STRA|nr:efflux ABC transporter permease/ATP-binding protein [Nitzschia inconspicua]